MRKSFNPTLVSALITAFLAGCGGSNESTSTAAPLVSDGDASRQTALDTTSENGQTPPDGASTYAVDDSQEVFFTDPTAEVALTPETEAASLVAEERKRALAVSVSATTPAASDFNGNYSWLAPGWILNFWGARPVTEASRETRAGFVYDGAASQRLRVVSVPAGSGAHFVYPFRFVRGQAYTVALYMRADRDTRVTLQVRRDAAPWNTMVSETHTINTNWRRIELRGTYSWNELGSLRIIQETMGANMWVDDMSISLGNAAAPAPAPTPAPPPPAPAPAPTPAPAPPPPAPAPAPAQPGGLVLPAAGDTGERLSVVHRSSMDEAFPNYAGGWSYNAWGSPYPNFNAGRETRAGYVYSGASSQRFTVVSKNGGETQLVFPYKFVKGKTYRASLKIRSDATRRAQVFMRRDAHPWDAFGSRTLDVTTAWQTVEIEGTYIGDQIGSLRVNLHGSSGTLWIDDVTISELSSNLMEPYTTAPIPDTFFGMHINKLGVHHKWPGLNTKLVRLWNTGTTWRDIEPQKGRWDFFRLDMYVNHVAKNDPAANILYTLGKTPQWASSTPNVNGLYGAGASGAPRSMDDWRNYVRTVARRYAGKIRYWEIWNEPDYAPHWTGPISTLVEMSRIARQELLAADPKNVIVGPGFSAGEGMRVLEEYLVAGGGQHVDIVAYHWYWNTQPEAIGPMIDNVRRVMKTYGVANKPLWNTEGAWLCDSALNGNCSTVQPSVSQSRSATPRALLIMAARGLGNFSYHTWEGIDNFSPLVTGNFSQPTTSAYAYGETVSWLNGARVTDGFQLNNNVYMVKLTKGTTHSYAMWAVNPGTLVNLPAGWTVRNVRTIAGTTYAVPGSRQLTLGPEPVLLQP